MKNNKKDEYYSIKESLVFMVSGIIGLIAFGVAYYSDDTMIKDKGQTIIIDIDDINSFSNDGESFRIVMKDGTKYVVSTDDIIFERNNNVIDENVSSNQLKKVK